MPENYIDSIVQRVGEIAKTVAKANSPISTATVLSVNPDGTVNVDDGMGGCARVAATGSQVVQCGGTVILGLEPAPGTVTNLCQVQFAMSPSGKPCPVETRTEDEDEVVVVGTGVFVDDAGNIYDGATGALTGTGPDMATIDTAYGYSFDGGDNSCWVGATPTYDALKIGDLDDDSGNQGETYVSQATVLCLNTISNVLLGAEVKNSGGGTHDDDWKLVLRNSTTFAIIDSTTTTNFLNSWMSAHPTTFYDVPYTFAVHISPDPEDGHFWVNPGAAQVADKMPAFKVSSADLSLLATVQLDVPDQFRRRVKRILL